ncbi:Uncharacterised protein (plasmid) [Legionella adelaidensis]|uniref:Transmembrane protein n=1 Tax=Legionella adelaidensis TaxID=45056 RepID=A0A0W0R3I6_9GAMM|nr:Thivi_2564 family membrane protein [Legionella adelaidensis]KTC65611.1 hypothetical protein Lade_0269 [Legionella adelaidensis]VEH85192.1 Uncharacterised protein [Legionella adelaidensis]
MALNALLNLFLIIVVIGLVMWLINVFIPMAPAIKSLLNILAVIVVVIYILQFFHIIPVFIPMFTLVR